MKHSGTEPKAPSGTTTKPCGHYLNKKNIVLKLNLLFFTIISIFANSQILDKDFTWLDQNNYKSVKEIRIYKDGKLGVIQKFNESGSPTFVKNNEFNGENIFAVWGYIYEKDKLKSNIFGHSNIGFSEVNYNYLKNKTEIYSYNELNDTSDVNSYSFLDEIKQINSISALINSKTLLKLRKNKMRLFQSDYFNDAGKLVKSVTRNADGKNETETTYIYSKNTEKIEFKTRDKNFDSETLRLFYNDGKLAKEQYRDTEILYSYKNNLLFKKSTFESGKLTESETYKYNSKNKIEEIETFVADNEKSFVDKNEYNEKGFLTSKTVERIDGISKFNYEYIYW